MRIEPFQKLSTPLIDAAGTAWGSATPLTPAAVSSLWKCHLLPLQRDRDSQMYPSGKPALCPIAIAAKGSDLHQRGSLSVKPKDLSNRQELQKNPGTVG